MTQRFSTALQLTDLNDYIGPNQVCIKPSVKGYEENSSTISSSQIEIDEMGVYREKNTLQPLAKASIKLEDCLACSGCVTTAESILVQEQSTEALDSFLDENRLSPTPRIVAYIIAPQVRASLAVKYRITPLQVMRKLTYFLSHYYDAALVCDSNLARGISLHCLWLEFSQRDLSVSQPLLASACPGWICYAEKTHNWLLENISRVKSPQQIAGRMLKYYWAKDKTPDQVYVTAVMPCYDKKLEASRKDFYNDLYRTRDVDNVLTGKELDGMIQLKLGSVSFRDCNEMDLNLDWSDADLNQVYEVPGSTSGGYVHFLMQQALQDWQKRHRTAFHIDQVALRGENMTEYRLVQSDSNTVVMKCATTFGFRHIQNLVRQMKGNKTNRYAYVEVMACPNGCSHGAGQVVPDNQREIALNEIVQVYQCTPRRSTINPRIEQILSDWLQNDPVQIDSNLHTQYHAVAPMQTSLAVQW